MDAKVKELLERIRETASVAAEAAGRVAVKAGKKAGETVELTKLNWKVMELNGEVDGLFKEIGKLVYHTHVGEDVPTEEVEVLLSSIDEKQEEIAEIKKKIGYTRRTVKCVHCGKECEPGDEFCRACGAPL